MAKQYKALKPVGRWAKGDIVGGLTDEQIKKLTADKAIEEIKSTAKKTQEESVNVK